MEMEDTRKEMKDINKIWGLEKDEEEWKEEEEAKEEEKAENNKEEEEEEEEIWRKWYEEI